MANETLDRLLAQYAEARAKLTKLANAIEVVAESYGIPYELPGCGSAAPQLTSVATAAEIRSDQFYGKAQLDAAEEYLRSAESAQSVDDILAALTRGGAVFSGKDPRGSLYVQLVRSTKRFVKLPSGEFGLLAWYPGEHAKRVKRVPAKRNDNDQSPAGQNADIAASGIGSEAGQAGGADAKAS